MIPSIFALIATVTASVVGSMEISPGLCKVDRMIEGTLTTEIVACNVPAQS